MTENLQNSTAYITHMTQTSTPPEGLTRLEGTPREALRPLEQSKRRASLCPSVVSPEPGTDPSEGLCEAFSTRFPPQHKARFARESMSSAPTWTTKKWASQLSLPRLQPTSERELDDWIEIVAPAIDSCAPTVHEFLAAATLDAAPDAARALRGAFTLTSSITTLYDLADSLSYQLFTRPTEAARLEHELANLRRRARTLDAVRDVTELVSRYARVCLRHTKYPAAYDPQPVDGLLRALPE